MNNSPCPRLTNNQTGTVIEVNANPFSLGRGLACNYVIPNKTISRVHCSLDKVDSNWILTDWSTNGTFVNGKLIKRGKSDPLKDNDTICLESDGLEKYIFNIDQFGGDISDEQLCAIADSVLSEVEVINANPILPSTEPLNLSTTVPPSMGVATSAVIKPLQDHMYAGLSSTKRARVGPPSLTLGSSDSGSHSRDSSGNCIEILDSPMTVARPPQKSQATVRRYYTRRAAEEEQAARNAVDDTIISVLDSSTSDVGVLGGAIEDECLAQPGPSTSNLEEKLPLPQTEEKLPTPQTETLPTPPQPENLPTPQPEKLIKPETVDKFQQPDNFEVMENELQCVICSELFIKAVTLNCSHSFCKYCIGLWNKNKSDCPICRTKITAITATIVLDNLIEKVVDKSSDDIKEHRKTVLEERKTQEEEALAAQQPAQQHQGEPSRRRRRRPAGRANRGGGNTRNATNQTSAGAHNRTQTRANNRTQPNAPRINVLDPLSINIGALVNNVIEVSSGSDWSSSDTESMSSVDFREEYDTDDWYDRPYYGGYGHCYRCGSPTHWANACPNR